jgi:hypothetical protein
MEAAVPRALVDGEVAPRRVLPVGRQGGDVRRKFRCARRRLHAEQRVHDARHFHELAQHGLFARIEMPERGVQRGRHVGAHARIQVGYHLELACGRPAAVPVDEGRMIGHDRLACLAEVRPAGRRQRRRQNDRGH